VSIERITVAGGNCFLTAIKVCRDHPRSKIVHGLPIGRGPLNRGKRYWHAWVEVEREGTTWVLDLANDRNIVVERDQYYAAGVLDEEHVWRFTEQKARQRMDSLGHYGPWVQNWRDMEEVEYVNPHEMEDGR
jgi:hypothetical protein